MKLPRPRRRILLGTVLAIVASSIAFDRYFFADTSFEFQVNGTLVVAVPLSLLAGTIATLARIASIFTRPVESRMTVRELMLAVVLLACGLGIARWWVVHNFATVYAPGYSEAQFRRIRIGMTPTEVESLLGRPILKDSTSRRWSPYENWIYSEPPPRGTLGDNYWRRWVFFENGRVEAIVDDYYVD